MKQWLCRIRRLAGFHYQRNGILQALSIIGAWGICDIIVQFFGWPLPSSVLGFAILILALESKCLSLRWVRRGASGLLTHFALFLVPALLAVVNHRELLSLTGLKLLVIVSIGTVFVMVGTAAVVEIGFRLKLSRVHDS